jgi:hypothetical protein
MTAIQKVLDRVENPKQSGAGRWMCKCPAHEDRGPSLSIREKDNGVILIHCFAGCGAGEVLAAIGLRMSDLFDRPIEHHLPPIKGGFSARELVELTGHEATVAAMLAMDAQTRPLTPDEHARLLKAAARLGKAQAMIHGR